MNVLYILFIAVFIIVMASVIFMDTRGGFTRSFQLLLRVALPMLLTGVIVKIIAIFTKVDLVQYIIAGIGSVIFYIVFASAIHVPERDRKRRPVTDSILGFLTGTARGWLLCGFGALFLNFLLGLFRTSTLSGAAGSFYTVVVSPAKWLLFLDFISINLK